MFLGLEVNVQGLVLAGELGTNLEDPVVLHFGEVVRVVASANVHFAIGQAELDSTWVTEALPHCEGLQHERPVEAGTDVDDSVF